MTLYFHKRITFRIRKVDAKMISKIVRRDRGERYDNESHFVRAAVLKLLREEKVRLRL